MLSFERVVYLVVLICKAIYHKLELHLRVDSFEAVLGRRWRRNECFGCRLTKRYEGYCYVLMVTVILILICRKGHECIMIHKKAGERGVM